MSSMRNAVQRRPHRERAQPLERRRLGLLEKHKDYSLRAKDYNKKKATLKSLRDKAADRNEDEFYFAMMSRKGPGSKLMDGKSWSGTVQGDRGNKVLDMDTVRLLKTQDVGYVRTMRQVAAKELGRLEEQLVLTRGVDATSARKIVFLENQAQREEVLASLEPPKHDDEEDEEEGDEKDKMVRRLTREVEHARKKVQVLTAAEDELGVQRAKMAKTATSGGHTRRGNKIMVRRRKR